MPDVHTAVVRTGLAVSATASLAATGFIVSGILGRLEQEPMAPWILGRASGFASYALIVVLVLSGLLLSHPAAAHLRWPAPATRLRVHVVLATFTLAFTVLHIVVLATDSYAGVGWRGAVLPMGSEYRPVGVTLGVIAVWAGLLAGVTASLAGRWSGRLWWPIHKVAVAVLVLAWAHGFWTGIDTSAATWFYLATGVTVLLVALSRYLARRPSDLVGPGARDEFSTTTLADLLGDLDESSHTDGPQRPTAAST